MAEMVAIIPAKVNAKRCVSPFRFIYGKILSKVILSAMSASYEITCTIVFLRIQSAFGAVLLNVIAPERN